MVIREAIDRLADALIGSAGAEAVVLGGSRAVGRETPDSDWDIGLYYRGDVDLGPLSALGEVHEPGRWGRIMNGGAWLDLDGIRVDVLLRDLSAVDHWAMEAAEGRFDIDGLPGYVAGIPTYSLVAEASVCRVMRGALDVAPEFPRRLAESAPIRWRMNRDFSLYHAQMHASRGNLVATLGQAARAVLEEAHARCCATSTWVLNEKHVIDVAGLAQVHDHLLLQTTGAASLRALVDDVRAVLST